MAKGLSQQIAGFICAAEDQGFRVKEKRSGVMIFGHGGGAVMLHRTPSDTRGVRNAQARLRAIGVAV